MNQKIIKHPEYLIISSKNDRNLKFIADWLAYFKVNFFCINTYNDLVSIYNYNMQTEEMLLLINDKKHETIINLNKLKTVFIRNGELKFNVNKIPDILLNQNSVKDYFYSYIQNLDEFLAYFFQKKYNIIGLWGLALINKLIVLEESKKCGFKIPHTYLKTNFNDLNSNENYISKTLAIPLKMETKTQRFLNYTARIKNTSSSEEFMTSLIQKEIKKLFEIRVFVFLKKIYAMAIFSQMNKESAVDYRVYNTENPYLDEPYAIPDSLKTKIFKLMKSLKLNTGSFDFIYTKDNEYYFLEVNPIGQFGYLGNVCGIDLNKVIAQEIIKYEGHQRI